jgi:iron complex transport system substrate-binding protein
MRVITLLPAATEIVAALGAADALVGVTHECDWPAEIRARPRVTGTPVDVHASARDVDAAVRAIASSGADLFTLDTDAITTLAPDLLVTQALCDVCAISEGDVRALAAALVPSPAVVTLGATTLDGVFNDIRAVGRAMGRGVEADTFIAGLLGRLAVVHERLKAARAPRPRIAVVEWPDPLYTAGHWVPDMIHRAGGVDVMATAGSHSTTTTIDDIRAAAPDIIVIAPCGYDVARSATTAEALLESDAWSWARDTSVWAMDSNALLSRPGPRLVLGIESLAAIMHPTLFRAAQPACARPVSEMARATRLR